MTYLLFAIALSLSTVAEWYAIVGLMAIFASSPYSIAIMGALLGAAKLVIASWLYRNWKEIPTLMKSYFVVALTILMLLTSMGIFGYLSKAHLDQAIPSGDIAAKLSLLDEKIKTEKENINANRKELSQLDSQVDSTVSRTTDAAGADRAISIRRSQQKDRARILNEIGQAQTKIAKLNEERAPIASEVRKVEAEVGPIKYIAAIIYGESADEGILEKAVRIVTLLIVSVFDPLAVLLLIAANWTLKRERKEPEPVVWDSFFKKEKTVDFPDVKEEPRVVKQESPPEEELPEIVIETPSKDWEPELYERIQPKKEIGRYLQEIGAKPSKAQSFLNKVQNVFSTPSKSIESEVSELQNIPKE